VSSQANVDALRPVYDAWSRGDFRPIHDVYGADLEWGWSEEFPDLHGPESDPSVEASSLRSWLAPWEDWRVEVEDFVASGDHVVALARYTGRGKESGVEVDVQGAHLWEFRDGRAVRLEVFSDRKRALEAAGLGPQADR